MEKFVIFLIEDASAESLVTDNDVEGFREYAEEDGISAKKVEFDSEEEQICFLSGYFHGCDERAPAGKVALIANIEYYHPFIEILKELCVI